MQLSLSSPTTFYFCQSPCEPAHFQDPVHYFASHYKSIDFTPMQLGYAISRRREYMWVWDAMRLGITCMAGTLRMELIRLGACNLRRRERLGDFSTVKMGYYQIISRWWGDYINPWRLNCIRLSRDVHGCLDMVNIKFNPGVLQNKNSPYYWR